MLRLLYSYGADMEEADFTGLTPFSTACIMGDSRVVDFFCRHCPACSTDLITLATGEIWPPIFFAFGYGHISVSLYLLERLGPISLAYRDRDGRNVLFVALGGGALSLAKSVLNRVLSFNTSEAKSTALDMIVRGTNAGITPLWLTSHSGDRRGILWVLESLRTIFKKSDFEIRQYVCQSDFRQVTPLHAAVDGGHLECARLLIQNGADVDCSYRDGVFGGHWTYCPAPILRACAEGNLDMVKLLLYAGARRRGDSATKPIAFQMGNMNVVRYLQATENFCSRLHYMTEIPNDVILDLLRSGADIHCRNEEEFPWLSPSEEESVWISPVQVAQGLEKHYLACGLVVPRAVEYVLSADRPWTPKTHAVFDNGARALAVGVFRMLGYSEMGGIPRDIWVKHIIPFAVARRNPPLSRSETNMIRLDSI